MGIGRERLLSARAGWIFVKFDIGDYNENLTKLSKILLKSYQNIGHFTWRPKKPFMFFDGSMKYFVVRQQTIGKPLHLTLYIFKRHLWINNNTDGMYCCLFILTVVNPNVSQCYGKRVFSTLFWIHLFLVFQTSTSLVLFPVSNI